MTSAGSLQIYTAAYITLQEQIIAGGGVKTRSCVKED
jgi:hypothetical protein